MIRALITDRSRGRRRGKNPKSPFAKKGLDQQEPVPEEIERLDLLAGCLGTQSPQQARTGKSGVIDFESIIQESLGDDLALPHQSQSHVPPGTEQQQSGVISHAFESSTPEMINCCDVEIAFHVPESVKQKRQ